MAYDGRSYIADKSIWLRARLPALNAEWSAAVLNGQIATCAICKLEILYSARTAIEFEQWHDALSALRDVPVTRTVCATALAGMAQLAAISDGGHRIPLPDYLIAATAEDSAVGVLHYDRDFDRLQKVFNFESRWIAPAGSID